MFSKLEHLAVYRGRNGYRRVLDFYYLVSEGSKTEFVRYVSTDKDGNRIDGKNGICRSLMFEQQWMAALQPTGDYDRRKELQDHIRRFQREGKKRAADSARQALYKEIELARSL